MSEKMRVRAAIVEGRHVVFYLEDGSTKKIQQGDPRLFNLMAKLTPRFAKGQVVEIDIEDFSIYEEFAKKSNGFVRFFKAAKEKIASFFVETEVPVEPEPKVEEPKQEVGPNPNLPVEDTNTMLSEAPAEEEKPAPKTEIHTIAKTYDQVKEDLQPVKTAEEVTGDESVIAVINGIIIPNIEKLTPYINHALTYNSEKAVHKFLERVSLMIHKRSHSVEDMFRFLEKGDLPLADDGSIIAYKILRKRDNEMEGIKFPYVDCHSGKVFQRVGTYVRVKEELVDKNRNNECSNGLHVARRGYIGAFSGDVCTLIKMAPEDVITVPHGDPRKIRVMGYHIIGELPRDVYNVLRSNKPMTDDPNAREMLAKAIRGEHIGVTEEMWIGSSYGGNLSIKNATSGTAPSAPTNQTIPEKTVTKPLLENEEDKLNTEKATALDSVSGQGRHVDPVEIQKQLRAEKAKETQKLSPLPKAKKQKPKAEKKPKAEPKKKAPKIKTTTNFKGGKKPTVKNVTVAKGAPSKSEQARALYEAWINGPSHKDVADQALQNLKDFQKRAKKGWPVLGFTQEEIDLIKGS